MKDGAEVRNIEDLREHFDIDVVVGYFLDGRLFRWLENFYYDTVIKFYADESIKELGLNFEKY